VAHYIAKEMLQGAEGAFTASQLSRTLLHF
jgi:hypothetical protein